MELLRTINHGLDLLCGNHFSESAATLRQALQMIADAVQQQQHDGRSAVPADFASLYFESVSIQDKLSDLHENKSSFVDHNTLYLHQEVFVFRHQHQDALEGPLVATAPCCPRVMDLHVRSLSAALMYNLAFAYQLQGIYERNFSSTSAYKILEKAGRLYEVAMTSLQGTTAQSTPYVMLAVLNNQAHLNMQVWNFGSIHRNMEAMKFLLEQLLAENMLVQNLDPMVLEAFHMNVVCAHGIEARSAPAA